jgi:hypothetical protein
MLTGYHRRFLILGLFKYFYHSGIRNGRISGKLRGRESLLDARDVEAFRLSRERQGDPLQPMREFIGDLLERETACA